VAPPTPLLSAPRDLLRAWEHVAGLVGIVLAHSGWHELGDPAIAETGPCKLAAHPNLPSIRMAWRWVHNDRYYL
jgi:hypothetical protein